ncbi:MAG: protein-L-isoaspartate(D-aspartate) O-methyltransferase [Candidatus Eremiobacteraeota bacterium]|nr:protein-L-isoaspartate(D-aspartate) O-methyltransferase [Candidatus Eremiobacteraeota bacterium]
MVKNQIINRGIRDPRVIQAFLEVDRKGFVPENKIHQAYDDHPLPIGNGQTISQPYMVAEMTEILGLDKNDTVLEIGTGSGYQTAILAKLAREVFTIEIIPTLAVKTQKKLEKLGFLNIHYKIGSGFEGWHEYALYNGIIVTAAPTDIPEALVAQLADGGRMVIPVGERSHHQTLYLVKKDGEDIHILNKGAVAFVPMVKE